MSQMEQTKEWLMSQGEQERKRLLGLLLEPVYCPIHQNQLVIEASAERLFQSCPNCEKEKEMSKQISFNERQKLAALAMRFYQGMKWNPQVGDYYCLTREGLELFQIRESDGENFYISGVLPQKYDSNDAWKIAEFQNGFGVNRVWVHPVIFEKVK